MKLLTLSLSVFLALFVTFFIERFPIEGLIIYFIFFGVILFSISKKDELSGFDKLITLLFIAPLIKILQLFINLPNPWDLMIAYFILLILSVYYVSWFKVGFRYNYNLAPLVVVLGGLVGFIGKIVLDSNYVYINTTSLFFIFPIILLISFSEELFFRGLVQEAGYKIIGPPLSVLVPSVLYSLSHFYLGFISFVYFFGFGIVSGTLYYFTKNISLSIIFSILVNGIILVLF